MTDTQTEIQELQAAVNAYTTHGGNKSAAATSLGWPRTTFCDRLDKAAELNLKPTVVPRSAEATMHQMEAKYKAEISELKKQLKDNTSMNITAELVREKIFGLKAHTPTPHASPDWVRAASTSPVGIPTLFVSDWHWGEVVLPEQVGGLNEFNREIAKTRFRRMTSHALELAFDHLTNSSYPGAVVALGGDMVSGDIHDELVRSNDGSTQEHVLELFDECTLMIDTLLKEFKKLFIPTAFGNHGRQTRRVEYKDAAAMNWDWLLYNLLERHYKSNPNVTFQIPYHFDSHYRVCNTHYLLTHGNMLGARGGDGVIGVIAPITRGIKKIKENYALTNRHIDYVIMGHWHKPMFPEGGMVNGCGKGWDEYAAGNRFSPEAPSQLMWWTHPKYGVTYSTKVFLEDPVGMDTNNNGVSVF